MKILVTGGTGYIGSHTVVELQQAGYEIVIIDNLSNSNIKVLDGITAITAKKPHFYHADCLDKEALYKIFSEHPGISGIIHFAASKAVGESIHQPLFYYRNNLVSLINLLDLMPQYAVQSLVFSSSCTVYGQPEILPVTENSPIQEALAPYGNTKQICEEIIRDTVVSTGSTTATNSTTATGSTGTKLKSIILRYFNPIGAHKSALIGELPIGVPQNLIPFLTQTAAGIRKELSVFGNDYNTPDGSCIRDYINVVDLAKAHVLAIERMLNNKQKSPLEYFNIGTGRGLSVLELIEKFEQATGVKVPHCIAPRREGDIEKVWADPTLANTELGWTAQETIEDTLRSAWEWQKQL